MLAIFFVAASRFFYIENINPLRIASSSSRVQSIRNSITIISKEPIFGVGFNLYGQVQKQYKFISNLPGVPSHAEAAPDNSVLFVVATTGVIGLISFIWLLKELIVYKYKEFKISRNIFSLVFISSIVGLLVNSLFINSFFYPAFIVWMAIIFALKERT